MCVEGCRKIDISAGNRTWVLLELKNLVKKVLRETWICPQYLWLSKAVTANKKKAISGVNATLKS